MVFVMIEAISNQGCDSCLDLIVFALVLVVLVTDVFALWTLVYNTQVIQVNTMKMPYWVKPSFVIFDIRALVVPNVAK